MVSIRALVLIAGLTLVLVAVYPLVSFIYSSRSQSGLLGVTLNSSAPPCTNSSVKLTLTYEDSVSLFSVEVRAQVGLKNGSAVTLSAQRPLLSRGQSLFMCIPAAYFENASYLGLSVSGKIDDLYPIELDVSANLSGG